MVEIRNVVHTELDLTEKIVVGELSVADVLEEITRFYSGPVTKRVLWDISQARIHFAGADEIRRIAAAVAQVSHRRAGGKSAVVAASDLAFGVSRMYQAYREIHNIELSYMSFRTRQEALDWLQSDST
jgi:hypothetical protein